VFDLRNHYCFSLLDSAFSGIGLVRRIRVNPMMSIAIAAAVMMIAILILLVDRLFSGAFCSTFKNADFPDYLQLFSKKRFFLPVPFAGERQLFSIA
jgi:hypothetical protein